MYSTRTEQQTHLYTALCVRVHTRQRGRGLILIISCQALGLALQTRWRKSKCVSGSCTCKCVCVCVAALPLKGTRRGSVPDSAACGISGSATRALKKTNQKTCTQTHTVVKIRNILSPIFAYVQRAPTAHTAF